MTQSMRQFGITYIAEQDRLLLNVLMADNSEIRLWLTRSVTRGLFEKIVGAMHQRPEVERIQAPEVKEAAINMSHQEAVAKTRFVKRQPEKVRNLMSETGPLVVKTVSLKPEKNGAAALNLKAINGSSINLVLDSQRLHSLCQLLIANSDKAAWGLDLSVGDSATMSANRSDIH